MKNYKKAISVLVAVFMLTALIPAMAQAEDIADLTIEDVVGHQPADMITENLILPEGYTYTAEPTGVINTVTGEITRKILEDTSVVLTATDADGISESFDLVIKAEIINVYARDNFAYDYEASADALSQTGFIFEHHGDGNHNTTHIVADGENRYLDADLSCSEGYNSRIRWKCPSDKSESFNSEDVIYIEFDMNYSSDDTEIFIVDVYYEDGTNETLAGTRGGLIRPRDVWGSKGVSFTENVWTPVAIKLDMKTNLVSVSSNGSDWVEHTTALSEKTINSIRIVPGAMSGNCGNLKVDNFVIYSVSDSEPIINAEKANEIAELITADAISNENSYNVENDLLLNAPFEGIDLEGVSVKWTSSDPSVISNDGIVTRATENRYVVMTATVTVGTGEEAVTVNKDVFVTVAADDSTIYTTYNYNFENDSVGETPTGWSVNSNSTNAASTYSGRKGNVMETTFTGSGYAYTANVNGGSLINSYFISADVCFEPDDVSSKAYFDLNGAANVVRVGFNFQNNAVIMSCDNEEREYVVPGVSVNPGQWYHIDINFNSARKNVIAYIDGQSVTAEPLDIQDTIWTAKNPVRQVGICLGGSGTGYVDNVTIRESNSPAAVYDINSDYTVRSIALTNQKGKTITNVTADTTKVIAKVKLIENREPVNGEGKVILTRYNNNGKLEDIVTESIVTSNKGFISNLEMSLSGDCSGSSFKIFVLDSDTIKPVSKNYNSIAFKFDTEYLFAKPANAEDALEIGYEAESSYSGIDAIIYDGDVYKGRQARHFAYIGLPDGASEENPVPAVVCVHGGGGTAYDTWVKKWNEKGYAAIAMDLNGRIPDDNKLRHRWAGASSDNYATVSPDDAAWMYSAVTAVIGAHNVLREMPEVDNTKIGIAGVSWGGVVTSTAIGVDDRFAFAIPSYGCGYLYGSETYMAGLMTEEKKLWDPSNFIKDAQLPILWMNGDGDNNFSLTSTTKSALLAGVNSYVSIIPGFGHSHESTWNRPEGYAFADSVVKNGTKFIKGTATVQESTITVNTSRNAKSATLYYTISDTLEYLNGRTPQFSFTAVSSILTDTDEFKFDIPSDAKKFYVVFKDENNYNTSTILYDLD